MNLKENTPLQGGKYRILGLLGQGGFGITYLALQAGLNREVVIKEFFMREHCDRIEGSTRVSLGTSGSRESVALYLDKFLKEARNIAALKHANIISIYDVFEENGTAYYVMEYHSAGSLGSFVEQCGALREEDALYYIRQVAEALRFVHASRIMHLDIKPDNILVDDDGNAVLIDFGQSKRYNEKGKATSATPIGISHGYAPMEQYNPRGVREFSPATDVYSLGATLFTLLTGEIPPPALQLADSQCLLDALYGKNVSDAVVTAIVKSMSLVKENRPQSIDGFLSMLDAQPVNSGALLHAKEQVRDGGGASKHIKSQETPLVNEPPTKPFNWKIPAGIVAAILCLVLAWVVNGGSGPATEPVPQAQKEKQTFTVNGVSFTMVAVEGGSFNMGSNDGSGDEKPVHTVVLDDYHIGETEVKQSLWQAVMGNNPSSFKSDDNVVETVSYSDCLNFIDKLNTLLEGQLPAGRKFRLPTEAEWEYAARGGNRSEGCDFSGSDVLSDVAWYDVNSGKETHLAKRKQPNELGIYDMSGNVYEWCSDWYAKDYYSVSPDANPQGPSSGSYRVIRGGSWDMKAQHCRVAFRNYAKPGARGYSNGLRLAL